MGIFSLVLLRNLAAEFVSKDLVLGLSKNLLITTLFEKYCVDLRLFFRWYLWIWLILSRRALHKRWGVVDWYLLFLPTTIRCITRANLHLWCTPTSDSSPLDNYWLDLIWLIGFLNLLR